MFEKEPYNVELFPACDLEIVICLIFSFVALGHGDVKNVGVNFPILYTTQTRFQRIGRGPLPTIATTGSSFFRQIDWFTHNQYAPFLSPRMMTGAPVVSSITACPAIRDSPC